MHHCYPLQWGGLNDGPQVPLCKLHHDQVHDLAGAVWKRNLRLNEINPPELAKLVKMVVQQRQTFTNNGGIAPEARRRAVVQLSPEQQQSLRLIKAHHGFGSQEETLKWLIDREARKLKGER